MSRCVTKLLQQKILNISKFDYIEGGVLHPLLFMIDDKTILDRYFESSCRLKGRYLGMLTEEDKEYLMNRFSDGIDSYKEALIRIKFDIEKRPVCPICGGRVVFVGANKNRLFEKACNEHRYANSIAKQVETNLKLYGVEHYRNDAKRIETCKAKFGHTFNVEAIKKYWQENFGCNNPSQVYYVREKMSTTCLAKHGVSYFVQSDKCRNRLLDKSTIDKRNDTKRKHKTFNMSSTEELAYKLLYLKFSDIKRQYRSEVYPFNCDFYVPSLDLYIECNFHWTHGGHPFDSANINDINKLQELLASNSTYKHNAAKCWSVRDVNKRSIAKANNLNYIEFWNLKEVENWIQNDVS